MARLGIFDFVREAFKVPYNVILVSGGFLAGIASFHPMVVWPIVGGFEILYLLTMANSSRFQAIVKVQHQQRGHLDSNDIAQKLVDSLNETRKRRFETVQTRCLKLQGTLTRTGSENQIGDLLETQQAQSVNQLLWVFLRTLAYEQALESFCAEMPREEIQRTLKQTQEALASQSLSEQMRNAYQENVDVLKKRLDNLQRAEENLRSIDARLIRVENSIMLIQEQALTRRDPAFIEAEVNSATAGLASVEQVLNSMDLPAMETNAGGPAPELLTLASREANRE